MNLVHSKFLYIFALIYLKIYLINGDNLNCNYHDSVDLTNSSKFENGSYFYDNIEIESHLINIHFHKYETLRIRIDAEPHYRGCICKIRKCIKWCCSSDEIFNFKEQICLQHNESISSEIKLRKTPTIDEPDEHIVKDLKEHFFGLHYRVPCKFVYPLRPKKYDQDKWHLFENGRLHLPASNDSYMKDEYCFAIDKDKSGEHTLTPFLCSLTEIETMDIRDSLYAYSILSSVPCLIITAFVYLFLPELRNLHGKSLICYLFSLSIGYAVMGYILLEGNINISRETCSIIGFLCYYFFMAAFFWLSVISFDLWWNFTGKKTQSQYTEKQRFCAYSIYCWGLSGLFLLFTYEMQNSDQISDDYKPGIGGDQVCFIDVGKWAACIYFYGPLLIIIMFNGIMFMLTSLKINRAQREMSAIMKEVDNQRTINTDKKRALQSRFGLFFRLFIIMGVTWFMEIITYLIGDNDDFNFIIYFCDAANTLHGILIFALFVLKKQVKYLIMNKYKKSKGRKLSRQYSRTTSSNIAMVSLHPMNSSRTLLDKLNTK